MRVPRRACPLPPHVRRVTHACLYHGPMRARRHRRGPPTRVCRALSLPHSARAMPHAAASAGRVLVSGVAGGSGGGGSRGSSLGRPSGQATVGEYPGSAATERPGREASPAVAARGPAYNASALGSLDSLQALVDGRGGQPSRGSGGCPLAPAPASTAVRTQGQASRGSRRGQSDDSQQRRSQLDYDDEARKLWARLNLDPSIINNGPYNALDPLWRHPESGGVFYVGNQTAAANLELLQKHKVTHVVNCTDSMPLYHERLGGASPIQYHRFDITSHYRKVRTDEEAVSFVQPMLEFVTAALGEGKNVMAHCLAGAHRAGTTGCIILMYFAELSAAEAVPVAKRCRPIIDPIGDFPQLLAKLERGWRARGGSGKALQR